MHFLASNSSLEDMLDKVFSGQTNRTKLTDLPDHSYAWLGETVGGLVTLLTLVIAVAVVWKKNAEAVGRILTALQSLLQNCNTLVRRVGESPPPPVPPRTHMRNQSDEERLRARALGLEAGGQHLYAAPAGGVWI